MENTKVKINRVKITPMWRLRILTNQRMAGFNKANLITPEFISDMVKSYEKQNKALIRSLLISSIYLAIMFTAYSGSGVKVSILGVDFSEIPKLLEITAVLFSFGIFGVSIQFLNLQILMQSIDSMISSVIPDDNISQGLIKYRYAPLMNFFFPFQKSLRRGSETISPVGVTKVVNAIMVCIAIAAIFSVFFIPVIFLLGFVIPSLTTSVVTIGVGILAWSCSCFLICSFLVLIVPLPYDETLVDEVPQNENKIPQ